jgi:hypothetical protein
MPETLICISENPVNLEKCKIQKEVDAEFVFKTK